MSVHYKFKSALDFDTITFDGLHISVSDLKKSIVHQKRLGKTGDFDLQITNAQTKEEYSDDSTLIPKNTSLIIARIPLANQPKKVWDPNADKLTPAIRVVPDVEVSQVDLSRMNGSEEDKIKAMMAQSTVDYDPTNYQRIRGSNQTGEVPVNYRCFKCHKPGHWIKNCPLGNTVTHFKDSDIKRNTGIPRSFIEQGKDNPVAVAAVAPTVARSEKTEIPEELICSICKNLFVDAVMIPCCGSSFCDECVRTALLESEDNECPDCHEKGSSPGSLIPNRFLRNSVNAFKNETGYNKPRPALSRAKPVVKAKSDSAVETPEVTSAVKESEEKLPLTQEAAKTPPDNDKEDNESDYEDNITVTVPPAHLTTHVAYQERNYIGGHRHGPRLYPPGLDTPPKPQHTHIPLTEERSQTPTVDEKESYATIPSTENSRNSTTSQSQSHSIQQQPPPSTSQSSNSTSHQSLPHSQSHGSQHIEPNTHIQSQNGYGAPPAPQHYQQGSAPIGRPYDGGEYNSMMYNSYPPRQYEQMGGPPYRHERIKGPFMGARMPYGPMHNQMNMRGPRPMMGQPNLAQVYQGVQAKVGSGIIDDPLEAFNRIMREKERRKEERRRSPPHIDHHRRRSRSHEMERRRSPIVERERERRRNSRHRSIERERRPRTPEDRHIRHMRESEERQKKRRSSSYSRSSRSSRSFSRSRSPIKRSRSPIQRKWSRTPPPPNRRSRSRSPSFGGFNRFNNRFRDRRDGPRDFEYRERSPFFHGQQRGRGSFRGRGGGRHNNNNMMPPQNQYRMPPEESYSQHSMGYHDAPPQNVIRYDREPQLSRQQQQAYVPPLLPLQPDQRYDAEMAYHREQYDERSLGSVDQQPPPPGFESEGYDRESSFGSREHYFERPENVTNYHGQPPAASGSASTHRSPANTTERAKSKTPVVERRRHSKSKSRERESRHKSRKDDKSKRDESRKVESTTRDKKKYESSEEEKKDKKTKEKKKKKTEKEKKKNKKDKKEKKEKKEIEKEKKAIEKTLKAKKVEKYVEPEGEEEYIATKTINDTEAEMFTPPPQNLEISVDEIGENTIEDIYADLPEEIGPLATESLEEKFNTEPQASIDDDDDVNATVNTTEEEENSDGQQQIEPPQNLESFEMTDNIEYQQFNRESSQVEPSDSFLDIHAQENFESEHIESEMDKNVIVADNNTLPLPEPSKWELEDENGADKKSSTETDSELLDDKSGKVTNEVLKRAENAIFARAINAIRPIEIKKISLERQKLYANDKSGSSPSADAKGSSPHKDSFQITVPTDSAERSVELKSSDVGKPNRLSIKERLGSKIIETEKSRSLTPVRKTERKEERKERKEVHEKEKEKEKKPQPIASNNSSRSESKRTEIAAASSSGSRGRGNSRDHNSRKVENKRHEEHPSSSSDRRGRGSETMQHDRKDSSSINRDREKEREKERERDKEREREKEREKERDKEREKERMRRDREKSRSRGRGDPNRIKQKEKEPVRDRDREREKDWPRDRMKPTDRRNHSEDRKDSGREKPKYRDHEDLKRYKDDDKKRKRTRSRSLNKSDKKDKKNRRDESSSVKRNESSSSKSTRGGVAPSPRPDDSAKESQQIEVKRSTIDEASFVPDYDEQMEQIGSDANEKGLAASASSQQEKEKAPVKRDTKRHHTPSSERSSSSSDSESSSNMESESKRKKNKKHKKQKKTKRSSSESDDTPKKKKKKEKKSKSLKKKRKNKHK